MVVSVGLKDAETRGVARESTLTTNFEVVVALGAMSAVATFKSAGEEATMVPVALAGKPVRR